VGCDGCTEDPDARQRGPDGAVQHTHGREEFAWLCQSQVAPSHRVHLRLTEPDHRSVARIYAPRLGPVTPNHRVHRPEAVSRRSRRRSPIPGLHEICGSKKHMKLLDPRLSDLTPAHIAIAWRYQVVRTLVDFGAAVCFIIESAFFFFARTTTAADWLFLVGSILFAFKPTIDVVRSMHLNRLPGQSDGPSHHTPASAGGGS